MISDVLRFGKEAPKVLEPEHSHQVGMVLFEGRSQVMSHERLSNEDPENKF